MRRAPTVERKSMLRLAAVIALIASLPNLPRQSLGQDSHVAKPPPQIAGLATVYYPNSHADLILGRLVQGYTLEDRGEYPQLKLASLHVEQFPANDMARALTARRGVPLYASAREALTRGGKQLAVDGVMLIAEHGQYPESDTGQFVFPKRPMFAEIVKLCEPSGCTPPVFIDKHLSDNWQDAKWIYDEARRLKLPLMAGSTLPLLWRSPPRDVRRDSVLREVVAISYHRLDSYGIHALEIIQSLVERRRGGETGIRRVRAVRGVEVWRALERGDVDRRLIDQALSVYKNRPVPRDKKLEQIVDDPALLIMEYRDGLKASVLSLGSLYIDWSAAWRYEDGSAEAAVFWTQELRPFSHFGLLVRELEPFFCTGRPTWPVERTLLTTGALDALLISRRDGGRVVETPHLAIAYHSDWNWREPPPPAPDRPLDGP